MISELDVSAIQVQVTAKITLKQKYELLRKTDKKKVPEAVAKAILHYLDCNMEG
jgi:hypothetical protein